MPKLPRVSEKVEQAHIVQLLRSIGAKVIVLGTTRRKGDYQGTMQTPGVADLEVFLPIYVGMREFMKIEVKSDGGRLSPAQKDYQQWCQEANITHVVGGLDAVIAKLVELGYLKAENVAHYRMEMAHG